jgi:hypothetical protein
MSDGLKKGSDALRILEESDTKEITVINDVCIVNNGSTRTYTQHPYVAYKIKSSHHAVAASLHIMLKHMADMHSLILEVIGEKYNIPYDDMVEALHNDLRIQKMMVEPAVHSLNYFTQEDLDAFKKKTEDSTAPLQADGLSPIDSLSAGVEGLSLTPPTTSVAEQETAEPKKTRRILKKPTIIQAPAQVQVEEPIPVSDPPKKKIIRKKAVVALPTDQ